MRGRANRGEGDTSTVDGGMMPCRFLESDLRKANQICTTYDGSHVVGVLLYPSSILPVNQGHAYRHSSLPRYRRANMLPARSEEG